MPRHGSLIALPLAALVVWALPPTAVAQEAKRDAAQAEVSAAKRYVPPDQDAFPLVREEAAYPAFMALFGIEGDCQTTFELTPEGTATDITITCVDTAGNPAPGFEGAALEALRKFKFSPKIVNGEPVRRENVIQTFMFRLHRPLASPRQGR
jgi:protein TonB